MTMAHRPAALLAALAISCVGPQLHVTVGTKPQGDLEDVECSFPRGDWCAPDEPKLEMSAVSDCLTTGKLWVAISEPPESRAQGEVDVVLPLGDRQSFPSPCFKRPSARRAAILVSVRGTCASGPTVRATVRCVVP